MAWLSKRRKKRSLNCFALCAQLRSSFCVATRRAMDDCIIILGGFETNTAEWDEEEQIDNWCELTSLLNWVWRELFYEARWILLYWFVVQTTSPVLVGFSPFLTPRSTGKSRTCIQGRLRRISRVLPRYSNFYFTWSGIRIPWKNPRCSPEKCSTA